MKKSLFGFAAALCAALVLFACSNGSDSTPIAPITLPQQPTVVSEKIPDIATSADYTPSNTWGNGWNLGNTLDACSYGDKENKGLDTETSWGMPTTTQEMIKAVAAKGFKTIRIPVSWHNHIINGVNGIDIKWLERVKTIVDWSLDAGMKVIINIHHDNLSEEQMSTTCGFCVPEDPTSELKNNSLQYILGIWTTLAAEFVTYDERLIFELLNEPRAIGKTYEWKASTDEEKQKVKDANKIIMEYEEEALKRIRGLGGNNTTRYVMVPPYAASPSLMDGWSLPQDSASNKLIVSVHAYTPYDFCMGKDKTFTAAHKSNIEDWLFATLYSHYVFYDIPVIIGETSATDKNNYDERVKWAKCFFGAAKAKGVSCLLWDNMVVYPNGEEAERHGYFNRKDLSWY